jgi:hypothetical protein
MVQIPGIVVRTRCFISEPTALDLTNIPGIHQPESLVLEEHDITEVDFGLLPDRTGDFVAGSMRPFIDVGHKEYSDQTGQHIYRLSSLMTSVVSMLSSVTADQIDSFCRRWSKHRLYSPFQGWENFAPEVALQLCQEEAFQKLRPFFLRFQPLCQQAVAEGKSIYFLHENHAA